MKLNTKEALRVAIANIEAIKVYDKNNYKLEFTEYQQGLRAKLRDLTMTNNKGRG